MAISVCFSSSAVGCFFFFDLFFLISSSSFFFLSCSIFHCLSRDLDLVRMACLCSSVFRLLALLVLDGLMLLDLYVVCRPDFLVDRLLVELLPEDSELLSFPMSAVL